MEIIHDGAWSLPLLEILEETGYERLQDFDNNALFQRKAAE